MQIHRSRFFLLLLTILILSVTAPKLIWLIGSKKTNGTVSFIGKTYAGQMTYTYSVVWFMVSKDTIWFNGRNGLLFDEGANVPVRYHEKNPSDARLDVFLSIWGDTVVYGGIPVLILLIIYLHPHIIPYHSYVSLSSKSHYIHVV